MAIPLSNVIRELKLHKGRDLPPIKKTPQMLETEKQFGSYDIRLIIKVVYEMSGNQAEVARTLNVEQSTISIWSLRLGIIYSQKPVVEIVAMPSSLAV